MASFGKLETAKLSLEIFTESSVLPRLSSISQMMGIANSPLG